MSVTIGVDVGGTKVAAARLEGDELTAPAVTPTEQGGASELLDALVAAVEAQRTAETEAVGIGVPSIVDWESGSVRTSVNVPLHDIPLRQVLGERIGLPVFIDNDATVAALAESWDDGEISVGSLVMLTVGTGVGGGLVLGGRVYRGATGAAAEAGHTIIGAALADGAPPARNFPQEGSLERNAAGTELDRLTAAAAAAHPGSMLGKRVALGDSPTGKLAVECAIAGDEPAASAVRILGERLGIGIANVVNLLDPEVVAIGGGASAAGELLLDPAEEIARQYILPGVGTATEIRLARRGPEAGVLGAALLARTELSG